MKRIFLTILSIATITFAGYSQGVHFGVKAGANYANIKSSFGDESETADGKLGLQIGAFATIMFSDNIGLQPELLYSVEGAQEDVGGDDNLKLKTDYIQIPILLRFQLTELFNIHVGPQFGININSKSKYGDESEDIDDVQTAILGIAGGVGLNFASSFEAGARYSYGISDIWDDGDDDFTTTSNVLQVFLAYRIK